ncbi:hypothetical protein [Natronococcus wangiae]|uniref:hypothetical protein n=1 Tax=Natronococcus wangiae TaxID=3068275 RepID=UPI00273DA231|nr:hypothetical protein [Natronococcus sp. AD5]
MSITTALKSLGAILVLASILSLVLGSGGFAVTDADRNTAVAVAEDENGHLGIIDNTEDKHLTLDGGDDNVAIYLLTDYTGEFEIEEINSEFVRFGDNESVELTTSVEENTSSDHDWEVLLECGSEKNLNDEDYITMNISGSSALSISAPERTTSKPVQVECDGT